MAGGWRRVFCTSVHRDRENKVPAKERPNNNHSRKINRNSAKLSTKFGLFSIPSVPRPQSTQPVSLPNLRCRTAPPTATSTPTQSPPGSPKLQCKLPAATTAKSPRLFSNPSSPRSPSPFSLLKSTLRLTKSRCGICLLGVKSGQRTAIFTAECSHAFHFPCIAAHVQKHPSLICPVCASAWKELPAVALDDNHKPGKENQKKGESPVRNGKQFKPSNLKVYDDDEPLISPTALARFNPIPESDETDEEFGVNNEVDEFQGFVVNTPPATNKLANQLTIDAKNVEVSFLPDAAVISVCRSSETYAVVLKVKAHPLTVASSLQSPAHRAPIDLVTVLDIGGSMAGGKLTMLKRAMRLVISSLSSNDRLSIVAFSANSKRLFPLRKMTTDGRRSARRVVDILVAGQGNAVGEALRKAAKVLEDRRQSNTAATIMLLSDGHDDRAAIKSANRGRIPSDMSSTRFPHVEVLLRAFGFSEKGGYVNEPADDAFAKCVGGVLSVVAQDLRVQIGFVSGSAPAEIVATYSCTGRPTIFRSGLALLGDLYAEEERELLVEVKVPTSAIGAHHVLAVQCFYKDPSSQKAIRGTEQALIVPRPHSIRSTGPNIERVRDLYVATRAVVEGRRLIERSDFSGAKRLLLSARALVHQSTSPSADEYVWALESELAELHRRRDYHHMQIQRARSAERGVFLLDEKGEPLTPTSAWRAAERLAKVAVMRKSLNRVSDLHGFENARF